MQAKTLAALALAAGQLQTAGRKLLAKSKKPKVKAKGKSAHAKAGKAQLPSEPKVTRTTIREQADAGGDATKRLGKTSEAAVKSKKKKEAPQPLRLTRSSAK